MLTAQYLSNPEHVKKEIIGLQSEIEALKIECEFLKKEISESKSLFDRKAICVIVTCCVSRFWQGNIAVDIAAGIGLYVALDKSIELLARHSDTIANNAVSQAKYLKIKAQELLTVIQSCVAFLLKHGIPLLIKVSKSIWNFLVYLTGVLKETMKNLWDSGSPQKMAEELAQQAGEQAIKQTIFQRRGSSLLSNNDGHQ